MTPSATRWGVAVRRVWRHGRRLLQVPDCDGLSVDCLRWVGKRRCDPGRDPMRAPRCGRRVEHVVERGRRSFSKVSQFDVMLTKKPHAFERPSGRLLSMKQRMPIVHCAKRHLRVNLANSALRAREMGDVENSGPKCVRLGREAKAGPVGHLEEFARRRGEDGACGSSQEQSSSGVRLPRAEPDRHVHCYHLDPLEGPEVGFDGRKDVGRFKDAVCERDCDPSALRAVHAGDPHRAKISGRRGWDSNPRGEGHSPSGFQDRPFRPLGHPARGRV